MLDDAGTADVQECLDFGLLEEPQHTARPRTISVRRIEKESTPLLDDLYLLMRQDYARPKTRADCLPGGCNEQRPCPFPTCRFHMYLDINQNGGIKLNFPELEIWEMSETCALDVADRDESTLEEVGEMLNLTRERIRQIQDVGLAKIRETDRENGGGLREAC